MENEMKDAAIFMMKLFIIGPFLIPCLAMFMYMWFLMFRASWRILKFEILRMKRKMKSNGTLH